MTETRTDDPTEERPPMPPDDTEDEHPLEADYPDADDPDAGDAD